MPSDTTQLTWHPHSVSRQDRERLNGHRGCVVWFTGLSGSGKSTIANLVDRALYERGVHSVLLDGDNVRHGLNASPARLESYGADFASRFGLTFSPADRRENIRRVGAVAELFASAGLVTLTAFVSPYRADRADVRARLDAARAGSFIEVFVDAPLEICEARDPKGLYKQARNGQIMNLTGVSDAYEPPENPELRLTAGTKSATELCTDVLAFLTAGGWIS